MPSIQERLNRLREIGEQSERLVSGGSAVSGVTAARGTSENIQERLNRLREIGAQSSALVAQQKAEQEAAERRREMGVGNYLAQNPLNNTLMPGISNESPRGNLDLLLEQKAEQDNEEKYDGLFGFVRGVGESAVAGIRSANEAIAGWLADFTPDAVKENISLVDVDADAARAAASAASGAVQERFGRTEESQEQGRERQQQATDYLTQRRNELDTGADVDRLFEEAANSQEEAARIREYTVGDNGAFAQLLFDAGVGGVQLGYDALMNFLIPGSGLASAGLRGAGSGILEAQQSGANTLQQLAYGLGVGAVEAATEKISNLAGPLRRVFGGGVADRAITSLVNRLTSSTAGRAVLNLAANAAGEGFEEFVSSAANPVLRRIFDENALAEYGDPQMWADAAYDALVGATIGGVLGGAGQVIENRANRRASQNAADAPTAGAVPQTGVDTSTDVNPVEAGIDASVRLFNEGGGVIDAQTPNNTASEDGSLISANENQQETTSDGRASQTGTVDTVSSPAGNSSILPAGANVNALADSMTDEQLALEQQRNNADIASINDVLNAAQGGQQFPQGIIDQLTGQLPGLMQEQQRLASVEQAKRVQRGEVSRSFGQPENHIDNRNPDSVKGNRVAAFSFDHPQLHGYFVQAARDLQGMADYAAEAERGRSNRGNRIDRERNRSAVEHAYSRELRNAMESGDLSKPQVLDACQRIIDNHGQENVLAAKRVELILDDMLTNGYTTADGVDVAPNMEYIAAKEQIAGARGAERAIERYDDDLAIGAFGMPYTDAELAEQEVERQRIREQYAALNQPAAQTSQNGEVSATDSTGAAPRGFDTYSAALERYGEMPERGTGAREVSIPRAMNDDSVVPQTVQTFANAEATPETTYTDITRILEQGGFNRAVITDRASLGRAEQTITDKGFQQALIDWTATVRSGRVSKDTTTLGLALYNNAINSGDTQTGIQILTDIVDNARTAAQATQAMSILNKLTPEGRLYGVQRSIANLQDELNTKYGDLAPNLHIDDSLAGDYLNAADEQTRFEILDQIYQDIANQVPQNWYDKLNAWRYFAMLANPRTHVRNVLGNSAMAGLTSVRNRISSGLQRRFVSDRSQRTRETISRRNSAEDAARYQVGLQEYKRINDMLGDAGKYTNELNRIRRHMRAPFNGVLGKAVDFASNTLEAEDIFFSQKAYASNLAQFLRARGITAEDYVSGNAGQEVIAEAQAYAIREAQRLTFRDFNTFSNFVQRIANLGGDSAAGRVWQTIVGANIPFTRTPANIVVRGVEYSPIGLARGLYNLGVNVKRGNMTAGEAIDQISSGLVGTALVGLGALLASQGVITGGGSDDEEQAAFDELRGFQPYALQIGGNSYTLDWLAPAALPFFTGAEIWNQLAGSGSEDEETNALEAVLQGIGHMTDPMLEMSMLSGISDLLDSVAYYQGSNSIWPVLSSSVTNYISQFFPSVFGAIERTIEDTRQSSYTDPTSIIPDDLQYPISQAMNRLPGEYNQVDYIDAWGRTESTGSLAGRAASNFVSPGYYSRLSESEVEDELQRVYDATGGEYNVFPDRATMGNTTINGERLTPEQYTEYATALGQTRLAEVSALMETDAYKAMSDAEKARAIQEVYDYALQTAKHAIDSSYEVDSRYEKAAEYGDIAEYLAFDRAWSSVEDSKGANTAAFEAVMQDYERMSTQKQNALMEALGENTRFDDVVDAYEAGLSPEQWYTAYDEYKALDADSNASAAAKATDFAKWLDTESGFNERQQNLLEEQFGFYTHLRADTQRYDDLLASGFTPDKANAVYDAVSALEPEQGKTQVSDLQRYEAIVGLSGLTEQEKVNALTEYEAAGSGDKQKFKTAAGYGISPDEFVDFLALKDTGEYDYNYEGSGTHYYSADETTDLVNAFLEMYPDTTRKEAAVLWAMTSTGSTSGNPFGQAYYGTLDWDYAP